MDARSYCDHVAQELTRWKARLYDAMLAAEKLSDGEKDTVAPMVQQLNALMQDLVNKTAQLKNECPVDYTQQQADIETDLTKVKKYWKDVWGALGEPTFEIGA
jgi:hypothetical protein